MHTKLSVINEAHSVVYLTTARVYTKLPITIETLSVVNETIFRVHAKLVIIIKMHSVFNETAARVTLNFPQQLFVLVSIPWIFYEEENNKQSLWNGHQNTTLNSTYNDQLQSSLACTSSLILLSRYKISIFSVVYDLAPRSIRSIPTDFAFRIDKQFNSYGVGFASIVGVYNIRHFSYWKYKCINCLFLETLLAEIFHIRISWSTITRNAVYMYFSRHPH